MTIGKMREYAIANRDKPEEYEFVDSEFESGSEKWERAAVERGYPSWGMVPDPDPIGDGMRQWPVKSDVYLILEALFSKMPDALVGGGGYLAWDPADIYAKLTPTLMVAFGVDPKRIIERNAYLAWEVGKPPDAVIEIARESTKDADLTVKRDIYAALGIREYWRLDVTNGALYGEPLVGEYLADGEYQRCEMRADADGRVWGYSGVMGINLWWDGERRGFSAQDPETGEYWKGLPETLRERKAIEAETRALEAQATKYRQEREAIEAEIAKHRQAREADEARTLKAEIARLRDQQR